MKKSELRDKWQFWLSHKCKLISHNSDIITSNCEFISCNSEKKSELWDKKSQLPLFFIQWWKWASISIGGQNLDKYTLAIPGLYLSILTSQNCKKLTIVIYKVQFWGGKDWYVLRIASLSLTILTFFSQLQVYILQFWLGMGVSILKYGYINTDAIIESIDTQIKKYRY